MALDIRKVGLQTWRDLQKQNAEPFNPETATAEDWYKQLKSNISYNNFADQPTEYVGLQAVQAGYGDSQYDEGLTSASQFEDLGDIRYENQPWYDTLANGVGKMLGTAGTTFVSSLVGLPYGLFQVANQGRWSALWDNDVTEGLSNVDKWLEENMTNYRSQVQQNSPWYSPDNLFSMNFIADDVIKNAGFTLGAAASMAVGAGSLGLLGKSLGFVNDVSKTTKAGAALLSSVFSATGEGMIEARQGVEERNKLETQKLEDALAPEYQELEMQRQLAEQKYNATGDFGTYEQEMMNYAAQKKILDERKNTGLQQIQESGLEMGNKILLANQGLLTVGNLIQFGKGMVKSFDTARHAAEISSKAAKPFGVRAVKAGTDLLRTGYKIQGKNLGKAAALTKGLLTEGSEEMNQQWIQSSAGASVNEADVNDYWRAKLDPEAYRETTEGLYTIGSILDRGFQESWGDIDQWEQFVIGGLTGMAGSYTPTKLFNQDKTKGRLDPRRYGSWEGGAYNELKDFNREYQQYEENINEVNRILQSEEFPERFMDMVGHTYTETDKTRAAEEDDKKAWKDADDKQFVHDIQSFLRAGKLDDLRAIYDEMGSNLSDEDIDTLVKNTTKQITDTEDKQNHDRMMDVKIAEAETEEEKDALQAEKEAYTGKGYTIGAYRDKDGNRIKTNDEIREIVKHNVGELNRKLDSYLDSVQVVNDMTHGQLTKDQEDNLVYLHHLSSEKTERVDKIMQKARKQMPSKFLLKTEKTPEQLQKQFASSDLAFTKDDNTKEGYVEVDTSLMNDKAFAAFFINNVIGGQNVDAKDQKEGEKNSEEQLRTNENLIRQAFINNAMQKNGMSLEQAMSSQEYDTLIDDINDAVQLHSEAAQFYNTYLDYMLNPQKVDQDKAKEEKKQADKEKQKKVDGASLDEMLGMNDVDLGSILSDSKKGKNKSGNKARKALGMKNGRSKAQKELEAAVKAGTLDEETASDAMKLLDEQLNRMAQEDDDVDMNSMDAVAAKMFDTETEAMNDPEVLLTDQELEDLELGRVEFDEAAYDARVAKAKDAINAVADNIEKELQEIEDSLDKDVLNKALDDDDSPSEKADKAVQKSADEEAAKNSPTPKRNPKSKSDSNEPMKPVTTVLKSRKQQEENPVVYSGETNTLNSDKINGQSGKNIPESEKPSWHPWMSSTSEVGQYTNEPYQPNPDDPNAEFKKKRYDAIQKKLIASGAYTARKEGKIKPGMKIGFIVFQEVNDEAGDFVIFITDEHGNIIGDLPSNDSRLATSKRDVPMDAIYEEIQKEWEDASDDEKKEGVKSSFHSEVEHVLVGKVRYQDERQTVEQLFSGKPQPVLFAIKTNASVDTSSLQTKGPVNSKKILYPKTGNVGQPYILIQTPGMHKSKNGFKYYAVPVHTKTIGEMNPDSKFIKALSELLRRIKYADKTNLTDVEAKKLLQELLAVVNVHVNLAEGSNTKKGLGIRVTAVDPNTKKLVPIVLHNGNRESMDIDAILNNLANIRANFSLDYINEVDQKDIKKLLTIDGNSIGTYNEMMAEIAETNAADTQTVNDWFTVRPLVRKGDTLVMTDQDDNLPEWKDAETVGLLRVPVKIKGYSTRVWTVDTADNYRVFDENGDEIIPTKESGSNHNDKEKKMAAIIAAEAFGAAHNKNADEPFAVTLWGQTQIYYPKKQRFSTKKDVNTILKEAETTGRTLTEEEKYDIINSYLENAGAALEESEKWEKPANVDHSEEVRKKIAEMEEDASHYHLVSWDEEQQEYILADEGDYYQDDRDKSIHARVSNVNDADIEVIEANKKAGFGNAHPQLKKASTGAGNVVDRFVRDFFAGKTGDYPNISKETQEKLKEDLQKFKDSLGSDWEINSTGMVAIGIVNFDGETSVNVAGTIDLLACNPKTGQYAIIDMKSSLAPLFTKGGKLKTDAKTKAKVEHWRAQQTLYKNFLEKKFGIKIEGIRIMPFSVNYSTKFNETDYNTENGVLKDKGYTVDIEPKYMGKLITLTPKTDVKYKTAQLPNSVKRLIPGQKPITKKPTDSKIAVKGQLIDLRDKVPEGRTLEEFISKEYADNQDVQKLCGILEENKGSNNPVMMTKASQDLLLRAIDIDALDKAAQEALAAKNKLKINIPGRNSGDAMIEAEQNMRKYGLNQSDIDELKELPEEVFINIGKDKKTAVSALNMLIEGADLDEIAKAFSSSSDATRHKKAKNGEYKKLNLQNELRWLTKNLPQISKERKLQIVKGLIACSDGTMDFGRVEEGVMQIGTQSEEGTVYHEAFHYVVQFLMTNEEIDNLFSAAQDKYGKMPLVALEERLADDFADYVKGIEPEENKIRKFFRELWNAIKSMFNNKTYIDTLFRDINSGVYSGREFRDDRSNVFAAINNEQRNAAKNYEYLTDAERTRIDENGIGRETFNAMTKEEQEYMLHCVV